MSDGHLRFSSTSGHLVHSANGHLANDCGCAGCGSLPSTMRITFPNTASWGWVGVSEQSPCAPSSIAAFVPVDIDEYCLWEINSDSGPQTTCIGGYVPDTLAIEIVINEDDGTVLGFLVTISIVEFHGGSARCWAKYYKSASNECAIFGTYTLSEVQNITSPPATVVLS